MKQMDIPAELVRKVLEYLLGEELPFALTCKFNLAHVKSLRKDGMLPMQRRSAYLGSRELTTYMLAHDMTSVDHHLMNIAAALGFLESMMVLRSQDPPCPWYAGTCTSAAGGGHLVVLQWARSQDPPCPWSAGTCMYAVRYGGLTYDEVFRYSGYHRKTRDRRASWSTTSMCS